MKVRVNEKPFHIKNPVHRQDEGIFKSRCSWSGCYEIVGEDEADIHLNKVSYLSPLAEALIGSKVDDEVIWEKPMGDTFLIIQKITY